MNPLRCPECKTLFDADNGLRFRVFSRLRLQGAEAAEELATDELSEAHEAHSLHTEERPL